MKRFLCLVLVGTAASQVTRTLRDAIINDTVAVSVSPTGAPSPPAVVKFDLEKLHKAFPDLHGTPLSERVAEGSFGAAALPDIAFGV